MSCVVVYVDNSLKDTAVNSGRRGAKTEPTGKLRAPGSYLFCKFCRRECLFPQSMLDMSNDPDLSLCGYC